MGWTQAFRGRKQGGPIESATDITNPAPVQGSGAHVCITEHIQHHHGQA